MVSIKRDWKRAALLALTIAVVTIHGAGTAHADVEDLTADTGCSQSTSYTASLTPSEGNYDVYVRLPKRGQTADVRVYSQAQEQVYGECTEIGASVRASGDLWTKTGAMTADGSTYTLQVSSDALTKIPDANRPSVLLVPAARSICQPTTECYVDIQGQKAYIRPVSSARNEHSLQALVVTDPAQDTAKSVGYYADGEVMYVTEALKPFDMRYASYGDQPLTRVISYESGQQAVIESRTPLGQTDSFGNYVFRLTQRYPETIRTLIWLVVGLLTVGVLLIGMRSIRKRNDARVHYGFKQEKLGPIGKLGLFLQSNRTVATTRLAVYGVGLLILVFSLILLVTAYVLQIVSVDGVSMQKTYETGDSVLVNKIPRTIAGLNGREFVPERGEVVIVRAQFGGTEFDSVDRSADDLTLIKRVLALPGERVVIKDGVLTVFNDQHPDGFVPDKGSSWASAMTPDDPAENIDLTLGPSELFVSGDNRPKSIDSRFNGPLAMHHVIGVVIAKW